jgi:uncharacterized protein DUF2795
VNRAQIEALLVGVTLPATKDELVAYARAQPGGDRAAPLLAQIPDRRYASLQEVGEEIAGAQPVRDSPRVEPPTPESGDPPGGPAYVGEPVEPLNVEGVRSG